MGNPDPYTRAVVDHVGLATYMEDKIVEEMGLELAFEGYRWADLQRIARRREKLSPGSGGQWLSALMNRKFGDGAGGIAIDLSNPDNWYLPFNWE